MLFTSKRRHTRYWRDWSSDVCSSDLKKIGYRRAYWVHTAEGPKRRYVSGKTRDEVHNKLIEALGSRAQGLVFDAGSLTVGEYLTRWLKDSVRGTVRVSTYEVHRHMIQPHIVQIGRASCRERV